MFFSFPFAILNGHRSITKNLVVNFWVLIIFFSRFFRPPFCNIVDVICHRLWAVWKWFSSLKKSTSLLIGFGLAEWFMPCRTICPRRVHKGNNHLHPQLLPIHREAWYSHPWGFHLLLKWKKKVIYWKVLLIRNVGRNEDFSAYFLFHIVTCEIWNLHLTIILLRWSS